jgi:uncharacterized damage-inducible protein DinB
MNRVERYRYLFTYEQDAHAKTLASLDAAASELAGTPGFQQALDLAAHLVAARRMWLFRFGILPAPPASLFPRGTALDRLKPDFTEMHGIWEDYLGGLTDGDLDRVFEYTAIDGGRFRNRIDDILTQLFGHSSYHRGQIALLLRQHGAEPAVTDFVFWVREAVESGQR